MNKKIVYNLMLFFMIIQIILGLIALVYIYQWFQNEKVVRQNIEKLQLKNK